MDWRKDLYQYEETPPGGAWDHVKKELEADVPALRNALADYEETPPAAVWQAVASALDEPPARSLAPVISIRPWYKRPAYIAAAAAIALIVLTLGYFFTGDNFVAPELSASVYQPQKPERTTAPGAATESTEPVIPQSNGPEVRGPEPSPLDRLPQPAEQPQAFAKNITSGNWAVQPSEDDNYIYLANNKGEVRRLSYKFEDMIPEITRQDSEMMREWTKKLQRSAFIPAGSNFFDIAEWVQLMNEEKQP